MGIPYHNTLHYERPEWESGAFEKIFRPQNAQTHLCFRSSSLHVVNESQNVEGRDRRITKAIST